MRIRTVKPEFWSHRMHEAISETASLLAIGLLNIADDEGRFLANPRYLECELFKVRPPKKKIASCIAELEAVGYIKRYTAVMDGRNVDLGMIPNFLKHQVISKPYPSRLAPPPFQEHSGNDTGTLQSDSMPIPDMEGKGRERNRKGIGKDTHTHTLTPSKGDGTENGNGVCTDKPNGNGQHEPDVQDPHDGPPDDDAHCKPPIDEPVVKRPNSQLLAMEAHKCYGHPPRTPDPLVVSQCEELLRSYSPEQIRTVFRWAAVKGQYKPEDALALTKLARFQKWTNKATKPKKLDYVP